MTESAPSAGMHAALCGSEDIALILDRAAAQQEMPVSGPRRRRERRGDDDQRKLAHLPIELGEAQIVANRQADATARQLDARHLGAGLDRAALVIPLLAAGERKQVDLVVAGDSLAVGTVDQASAAHAVGVSRR